MRIFNKIVVVLGLLVAFPVATLALAFPVLSLQAVGQVVMWLQPQVDVLSEQQRLVMLVAAVGLDLLLLVLLYAELRRPAARQAPIRGGRGGVAEVTVDAISQRIEYEVGNVAEVHEAVSHVDAQRGRVRVSLDIVISPRANLPDKIGEIVGCVRQTVETEMGLRLAGKPEVRIKYGAFQDASPRVAVPGAGVMGRNPPPPGRDVKPTRPRRDRE